VTRNAKGLDDDIPTPLYEQLAAILRAQIESGELAGRIPSIRHLAQEYEVAMGTANKALGMLKDEGLVVMRVGRGGYVAKRP